MKINAGKFHKKSLFIIFFFALSLLHTYSHALDKNEEKYGVLAISLEKRIKEPFRIESYKVIVDGKIVLKNLIGSDEFYGASIDHIPAGTHQVLVKAVYAGSGYGIFDYHENYKYPVRSETEIEIREGSVTDLKIIFNDNVGFLAQLEKRPFISFERGEEKTAGIKTREFPMEKEVRDEEGKTRVKAKNIEKIFAEKGDHLVKVTVAGDGFFEEVKAVRIDKPDRIVIDILGVKELLPVDKVIVKSPLLHRVRVGQHPHMSRVVLDIPYNKKLDYDIEKTDKGLIITVFDGKSDYEKLIKREEKGKFTWNLRDVHIEQKEESVEVLFAGSGSLGIYEDKRITKPNRIVIDIKHAGKLLKTNRIDVNSPVLNAVRIGRHPDKLRLVLDIPQKRSVDYHLEEVKTGLLAVVDSKKNTSHVREKSVTNGASINYLREISIAKGSVEVEVTLRGSGHFEKYDVRKAENPARIIIDLPGVKGDLANEDIMVDSSVLNKVSVGYESGLTRVVAQLKEGIDVGYDLMPSGTGLIFSIYKKDE